MGGCMIYLICLALLAFCAYREWQWAKERTTLLQRIQAPEVAVYEQAEVEREPVPKIGYEDDAAFIAAKDRMNNGS
jgi:hypothetical protein